MPLSILPISTLGVISGGEGCTASLSAYVIGNVLSAVSLILTNKRVIVIDKFRFIAVLTGLHFYATFLLCCLLLLFGLLRYKNVNNYRSIACITLGSLVSVIFMNFTLAKNSVGFYQISKLSCIPVTLFIESMLGVRQQHLTTNLIFSLSLIMIGMTLVAVHEVSFNTEGLLWAILGVCSTSAAQVWFAPLQKDLQLDALQLLFHTSPWLTFAAFSLVPVFENTNELIDTTLTSSMVYDIACSCVFAALLNSTNYLVLSHTSPLSYQIIGHIKTMAILICGYVFYDSIPSNKILCGIGLALTGVFIYTFENHAQKLIISK